MNQVLAQPTDSPKISDGFFNFIAKQPGSALMFLHTVAIIICSVESKRGNKEEPAAIEPTSLFLAEDDDSIEDLPQLPQFEVTPPIDHHQFSC